MRISDWSSDVCSSDLQTLGLGPGVGDDLFGILRRLVRLGLIAGKQRLSLGAQPGRLVQFGLYLGGIAVQRPPDRLRHLFPDHDADQDQHRNRSEEHTSELQSLMRISYAVFCLKKKNK